MGYIWDILVKILGGKGFRAVLDEIAILVVVYRFIKKKNHN